MGIDALAVAGGGTPDGVFDAARRLVEQGATALISFGLAGGLDPALMPGALVVPEVIVDQGTTFRCDASLVAIMGGATVGRLTCADKAAVTVLAKARLYRATGAAAIDLESAGVARAAQMCGVPFAVMRAVVDPAWRDLPPAAQVALDASGRIALRQVIGSIVRQPGQISSLLKLATDAAAARRTLRQQVALRFLA